MLLTGKTRNLVARWLDPEDIADGAPGGLWVCARDGYEWVNYGDWIIMDPDGNVDVSVDSPAAG
jgi:hypothetical protein